MSSVGGSRGSRGSTPAARPLDLADLARRATAAAQHWRPGVDVVAIEPLQGGQSSLTFSAIARGGGAPDAALVLKVAPPGLEPVRNRDVLRQARLLRALGASTPMKVPDVHFEDAGDPPEIPPLFAMARIAGRSFEPHLDPIDEHVTDDAIGHRAREAARLLAVLHAQDAVALGVGAEPVTTLAAEVDRWQRAFTTVPDLAGERATAIIGALRSTVPAELADCLLHGDYRLGNMLSSGSSVNAVIDWEIWSRGDPRIDVSWFLLCADASSHPTAIRRHPGMPAADELLAEYRSAGGRELPDLRWFRALALTKMAATTALIAKHNRRMGQTEVAEQTGATVPSMLEAAWRSL